MKYLTHFERKVDRFLNKLEGQWIIGFAPGHDCTNYLSNVYCLFKYIRVSRNFEICRDLIIRTKTTLEKHKTQDGHSTKYYDDMESMAINSKYDLREKQVLILDDITTSGSTLIACRCLALRFGAKKAVCLAISKTKGLYEKDED